MRDTYVARQPIFNAKRQTVGYELLFRDGENNAYPAHITSNRATYRLIVENFLSLGTNPSLAKSRCFINFPYQSLIRRLPESLPKEQIVVEVLETCEPTDELFGAIKDLSRQGYVIALDDFVYTPQWKRFLPYVQIIKLDVLALGLEAACQIVKEQKNRGIKRQYLAEKVETEAEYVAARSAGFSLFQGYFFSKPILSRQKYVTPEHLIAMELLKEVCQPRVDFDKVEAIVAKDIALSYQLLRFVNTMSERLSVTISSFRQALVYLGEDKLRVFVSLAVASYISTNKPAELYNLSLQRAQFCLLMSYDNPFQPYRDQAFLIGLFSVLDALLDLPLEDLVSQLPLNRAIKLALLERQGPYGDLLLLEECYERCDWHGMQQVCRKLNLSVDDVMPRINEAQRWSQDVNRLV